ncbi:kelch-like protein 10 [Ischnura elegans]|uniref:kelch-like protein 10 n=1 Tax=Ischnura elegans TaxID=197161 RepID=UPI001ED87DE2|nr:kelch-like protein 10 [Ischnura elegans]
MEHGMRTLRISRHRLNHGINGKAKTFPRGRYSKRRKCSCFVVTRSNVEFPKIWNELRENGQLCDGLVKCTVGNAIFRVHRAIISAVSPYFRALFTNSLNGGNPEVHEVSVDNVPPDALKLILDYAYTGTCAVTQDNVEKLLPVADQFEVLGVIQLCCEFLLQELQPENCLGIFTFAHCYSCIELENTGWEYILRHFMEIVQKSGELVSIDGGLLQKILLDDKLNVSNEEMTFWAVKLWTEGNIDARCQDLPKLLQCIRFGLMKKSFFDDNVMKWNLLGEQEECKLMLAEATALFDKIEIQKTNSPTATSTSLVLDLNHHLARPRMPYEILFAIGGWSSGSPTSFIETYDVRSDRWLLSLTADSTPRAYHSVVAVNGLIYMIGGFNGNRYFNTMRQYNPVTKTWNDRACMHISRCYVSSCVLNGLIYALGGFDGEERLNTAERYCPSSNQWERLRPMQMKRSDAGSAALNGKVYIVGGFDGDIVMCSTESYDPKTNQWTSFREMRSPRSGVTLAVYHNTLYAIGGFDGVSRLTSVEKLCPSEHHYWRDAADMLTPRSNFSAAVLDDLLFVVGGFNGYTTVPLVEYYDEKTGQWNHASSMNLNRSALSVCVIPNLPNAMEYSYLSKMSAVGEGRSDNGEGLPDMGMGERPM